MNDAPRIKNTTATKTRAPVMGSLAFPPPANRADYLRLPTLRLEPDRFSPTLHFGAGDSI